MRALRGREAAWAAERAEVEGHVATLEEALEEARVRWGVCGVGGGEELL